MDQLGEAGSEGDPSQQAPPVLPPLRLRSTLLPTALRAAADRQSLASLRRKMVDQNIVKFRDEPMEAWAPCIKCRAPLTLNPKAILPTFLE